MHGVRVLLIGWSSVLHGEATAGDLLSTEAVAQRLRADGAEVDLAWSPAVLRAQGPRGGVLYEDADEVLRVDPAAYTHVVWACGPLTGRPVERVHERFPHARRLAVGVSVLDPAEAAVTGFHAVVPRDAPDLPGRRDLAARPAVEGVPVVGVYLTRGQGEYGARRRHDEVAGALAGWLGGLDAARLELDTRVDPRDWRLPATAEQVLAVVARLDVVVTTRLHGLVLALRSGVPALAVDPVAGGGKVSAQARAWGWPALLGAEEVLAPDGALALGEQLAWCTSGSGRAAAARARREAPAAGAEQLQALTAALHG
ncbi:polysaccharide pyruvyl transferase family protein [Kineococcus esterisolvens]|uniref:polysaccharide pyruvyl transferase family protein n=1 Tax=unclassified Kineococcus TaxID=2621656 RepID=UPI003D7C3D39